jgi:hypothetical protein
MEQKKFFNFFLVNEKLTFQKKLGFYIVSKFKCQMATIGE